MTTTLDEIRNSMMTRIAGQTENVALDVETEAGKNRAYVSSFEVASSGLYGAKNVSTTAVALYVGTGNQQNRRVIVIQNLGNQDIYIGFDTSVTVNNGFAVFAKTSLSIPVGSTVTVYGITASGTQSVRILEMA